MTYLGMHLRINISLFLFFFLLFNQLKAEKLTLTTIEEGQNITEYFVYYEDVERILSAQEAIALSPAVFQPIRNSVFGKPFSFNNYWLKVSIENKAETTLNLALAAAYGLVDTAQYFLVENQRIQRTHLSGKNVLVTDSKKYPYPYFRFELAPGFNGDLYIKVNSCQHLFFPLHLWHYESFIANYSDRSFFAGVAFGTILLFAFAILVFYFLIRERFFLYYLAYIFSVLLFEADYFGLFYIFSNGKNLPLNHLQFLILCAAFFALFVKAFFKTKEKYPFFNYYIIVMFISQCTAFCIRVFYHNMPEFILRGLPILDKINISSTLIFAGGVVYITLREYKKRGQARYIWLLFCLITYFISIFFYLSMIVGTLSIDAVTIIMPSVLFIEMVFMFGVIAYEYIEIQNDKKQVEFALLNSRQEALSNLLSGQELERDRLAKELHDSVGSMLAVIKLKLGKLKNESAAIVNEFGQLIENVSSEVRQISHDLMPTALMMDNLNDALQSLCRQYDEKEDSNVVYYGFDLDRPLPRKLKIEIYRIVQQLLKNAHTHAQATQVLVQVVIGNNYLHLTVEDDGIGFDLKDIKRGIGLNSINSRIAVLKGSIKIETKENEGSSFQIEIPLNSSNN